MTSLAQTQFNSNTQPLVLGEFTIRQDEDGRYCLNDLHKASGNDQKHFPAYFLRNQQAKDLINLIECENYDMQICTSKKQAVNAVKGKGKDQGTYVVKELVYSYAMWISAKFHLMVIRAYDAMVMQWKINDRQSISPEQQALLHEIVDRRSKGERKAYAEMWSRHNRHFKIPRYVELLAIHFPEAVHYLETMELKAKTEKHKDTEPHIHAVLGDQNVQFLMWYVPILAKFIKDELYPALQVMQSNHAGRLGGLTSEVVCHANLLNQKAIGYGLTLNHVGDRQPHSIEWYLA